MGSDESWSIRMGEVVSPPFVEQEWGCGLSKVRASTTLGPQSRRLRGGGGCHGCSELSAVGAQPGVRDHD